MLLDNGRSAMLGTEFQDMLRCIRCAACLNHCPVYGAVGGHAYGWVYPGPMGSVLTPKLIGVEEAGNLPNASTFCGRCESVCPMKIPLPKMMRHWREREFEEKLSPAAYRSGLSVWAFFAQRPALYHALAEIRRACSRLLRPRPRPLPRPAAGRRLDHRARHAGAAGPQLPRAFGPSGSAARSGHERRRATRSSAASARR